VGQRVTDILAIAAGLEARPDLRGKPLFVAARGFVAVPALFAAAVQPDIRALFLAGAPVSLADIVDTENYNQPFSNFVPNLLLHTDLPQLANSIEPRRVVLGGSVNGEGRRMAPEEVRKQYGEAAHIQVLADAAWAPEAIIRALSNQ
jgi:hypothetical protein